MTEWLELETRRSPFEVIRMEMERNVRIGGMDLRIRPDRVDKLANGTYVVIDYKTGPQSPRRIDGDRPDEPQLPIYAVTSDVSLSGVAFGVARLGELKFSGVVASDGVLPGLKPVADSPSFPNRVREWGEVLDRIATDFRTGVATVDPKNGDQTCRYCWLDALCRVGGRDRSLLDVEDGAEELPEADSE